MSSPLPPDSPAPAGAPAAPADGPLRRVASRLHLPLAGGLTAFLGIDAGGYFPDATGIAAAVLAVGLLLRVTLAPRPLAGWTAWGAAAAAAGALLAAWTLLSASWSGSAERALVEFDRALLYVLALALYASFPWRPGAFAGLVRWILAGLIAVALVGLSARLFPDLVAHREVYVPERMSYPVTYWNGMGVACALAFVLALHVGSGDREPVWARLLATAAVPVSAVAVYCTYSRGAIATAAIGTVLYLVAGRPRRLVWTALAGGLAAWVALRAAYDAELLGTGRYASAAGVRQGHEVARALALATGGAFVARAGLLLLEGPLDRWAERRRPPALAVRAGLGVAAVAAVAVAAVALGVPARVGDAIHDFQSGNTVPVTENSRDRLGSIGNNGRIVLWRTALDIYRAQPLHGSGAAMYRPEWLQRRENGAYLVNDAHNLYLETLAELGWVGGLLLGVVLLLVLGAALVRARGPDRHAPAAVLAAGAALCVHAAVDWDWELPVLWVWLFAAGGMLLAGTRGRLPVPGRLARVVGGLGCLLLLITPLSLVRSQVALQRATSAFTAGDCPGAVDGALAAIEASSVRAEPFELLAWCDLRAGSAALAERAMRSAQARDPSNWQYAYGLAVVRAAAGQDPRPATRRAMALNPRYDQVLWLARAMRGDKPARWRRAAARADLPVDR